MSTDTYDDRGATRIVLIGPPGAGKGVQADLLNRHLGLVTVSTGALMRALARERTPLGRLVAPLVASGALLPDQLVSEALRDRLDRLMQSGEGFVIDGFPRTVRQAIILEDWLRPARIELAIELVVPLELSRRRLVARARDDDHSDAVDRRLQAFAEDTQPVITRYRRDGRLVRVDGRSTPDEVHAAIVDALAQIENRVAAS